LLYFVDFLGDLGMMYFMKVRFFMSIDIGVFPSSHLLYWSFCFGR
jgi:hypothetical protein